MTNTQPDNAMTCCTYHQGGGYPYSVCKDTLPGQIVRCEHGISLGTPCTQCAAFPLPDAVQGVEAPEQIWINPSDDDQEWYHQRGGNCTTEYVRANLAATHVDVERVAFALSQAFEDVDCLELAEDLKQARRGDITNAQSALSRLAAASQPQATTDDHKCREHPECLRWARGAIAEAGKNGQLLGLDRAIEIVKAKRDEWARQVEPLMGSDEKEAFRMAVKSVAAKELTSELERERDGQ